MLNQVVMYRPICRELLEDLFQSAVVAQSFREIRPGAYAIELPDRDIKRLKSFGVAHAVINYMPTIEEVTRKLSKFA
jgi:hypothetical protein